MIGRKLSSEDVELIVQLARQLTGTKVSSKQHGVIVQNVASRIHMLGLRDLEDYLEYVDRNEPEVSFLLGSVTIHTTSWFREAKSFDYFQDEILRSWNKKDRIFKVLCVACSTGEELYTIAAICESFKNRFPDFDYQLEGWDIDPISVDKARRGLYRAKSIESLPTNYKEKIERISTVKDNRRFLISDKVRNMCSFKTVNVLHPPVSKAEFDYITCRNMLIYFNENDVAKIMQYLHSRLKPGAYLCLGFSETSAVDSTKFENVGPASYRKLGASNQNLSLAIRSNKEISSKKLMLVANNQDFRVKAIQEVVRLGYEVLTCKSLEEASALLERNHVGFVYVDNCDLSKKETKAFAEKLRSHCYSVGLVARKSARSEYEGWDLVLDRKANKTEWLALCRKYLGKPKATKKQRPDLLLFGASTGGTEALSKMLINLPRNCPPVMVVQHITSGFANEFAKRLARVSRLTLASMKDGEPIQDGYLYIPLSDYHIGVRQEIEGLVLQIYEGAPISSHRPSVDYLFSSCARTDRRIFAALMTGMGKDGARGLFDLKNQGADTYAQDEASCVVFGMPKEAEKLNAVGQMGSPMDIRNALDRQLEIRQERSVYIRNKVS